MMTDITDEQINEIEKKYTQYMGDSWGGNWGISCDDIMDFAHEIIDAYKKANDAH